MVFELRKFVAPEIVYGRDAISKLGQYAANFGSSRALLVTDEGVLATGLVERAVKSLEDAGSKAVVYSAVTPNPRVDEVMNGAAVFASNACDIIVALGGGSPMDCAKGVGIVSSNGGSILDYEGVDKILSPIPPLICVPTTSGSSADVSQFAIISDFKRKFKFAIISKSLVPDLALLDPSATFTMDPFLTACTGLDAFTHALEAYVSNAHSELTDLTALRALELISSSLLAAIAEPHSEELRGKMMMGSLEAGLAYSNASLGVVHAMAHALGGFLDLPHGECNALLLEHAVRFNFPAAPDRYRKVAAAMGLPVSGLDDEACLEALAAALRKLRISAGIVKSLGFYGVDSAAISLLSANAVKDPSLATNPRKATRQDLEALYASAL